MVQRAMYEFAYGERSHTPGRHRKTLTFGVGMQLFDAMRRQRVCWRRHAGLRGASGWLGPRGYGSRSSRFMTAFFVVMTMTPFAPSMP